MARRSILLTACLAVLLVPAWAGAQPPASGQKGAAQALTATPAPKPAAAGQKPATTRPASKAKPTTQPPATGVVVLPGSPETYSYRAEGRRDPFVPLMGGLDPGRSPGGCKAEGLACLSVGDIVLKGIVQSRGRFLALVQGPASKRPYIVRANDKFADGVVKAITADSMFILQEVNDPLSLTKQREIRKTLRAVEEVK